MELLAAFPEAPLTVHDAESEISPTLLLQMPSARALATDRMVLVDGSHVKDANVPSDRAAMERLDVQLAVQTTACDADSANFVTPLP